MNADFYVLSATSALKAWTFTCQLLEQRYQLQQKVYVAMKSPEDAVKLDNLLWTFKDISFVPHALYEADKSSPIIISGDQQTLPQHDQFDTLLNLSNQIPYALDHFHHLIEIVYTEPNVQQLARERFRYYREHGITLNTIKD